MRKVIYSKFSNDRNPSYKIRTDICEDEQKRYVVKSGVSDEGKKHIQRLYEFYEALKKQAKNTIFEINKGTLINGELNLEYLSGDNLEKLLDDALKEKAYERFNELIKKYTDNVRAMADEEFIPSEEYRSVFGENADMDSGKSMQVSDIDMIFANVIINNDKWTLIDYEWSFSFKIPVDYILFRTIHYYDTPDRRELLNNVDLYELMGISTDKIEKYEYMENCFQSYTVAGNKPLWMLYDIMGKPFYNMPEIAEAKKMEKPVAVKIYKDESSSNDIIAVDKLKNGVLEATIYIDENVKALMFCPAYKSCIMKILEFKCACIEAENQVSDENPKYTEYELKYLYNGVSYKDNVIFCKDDNPYIMIDNIKKDAVSVVIRYKLLTVEKDMRDEIDDIFGTYIEIDNLKAVNKQIMAEDYQVILELQNNIDAIKNSTSWMVTKPLRNLKRRKKQ